MCRLTHPILRVASVGAFWVSARRSPSDEVWRLRWIAHTVERVHNGQGNLMNRRVAGLLAALALIAAAPAASATADNHAPPVVAAKSCSSGYVHAVVPGGAHKCLRAGQFCSRRRGYQRVYHRAGFHCKRNGHLTYY